MLQQVKAVVEADVLSSCASHLDDEVGTGNEVAKFGERFGEHGAVVEVLCFAEDEVEAVEGTLEAEVAADNADVVPHDFLQLALGLCDEDHLLVEHHALGIPVGDLVVEVDMLIC